MMSVLARPVIDWQKRAGDAPGRRNGDAMEVGDVLIRISERGSGIMARPGPICGAWRCRWRLLAGRKGRAERCVVAEAADWRCPTAAVKKALGWRKPQIDGR